MDLITETEWLMDTYFEWNEFERPCSLQVWVLRQSLLFDDLSTVHAISLQPAGEQPDFISDSSFFILLSDQTDIKRCESV